MNDLHVDTDKENKEREVLLTEDEMELLLHKLNNAACKYSMRGEVFPLESIRHKLLTALRGF